MTGTLAEALLPGDEAFCDREMVKEHWSLVGLQLMHVAVLVRTGA